MTVAVQRPTQDDPWDKLSKALQIGASVYGIKSDWEKLAMLKEQHAQTMPKLQAETEKAQAELASTKALQGGEFNPYTLPQFAKSTGMKFSFQKPQGSDFVTGKFKNGEQNQDVYLQQNNMEDALKQAKINYYNNKGKKGNGDDSAQKRLHDKLAVEAQHLAEKFEPVADYYGRMLNTYKTEGIEGLRSTSSLEDYIKIIDPSAVIRMGKIDVMKESMSPVDKLAFMAKKLKEGGVVDEKQIAGMLKLAGQAYEEKAKLFKDRVGVIQKRAKNYGLPDEWVSNIMPISTFYNPAEEYNKAIQSRQGKEAINTQKPDFKNMSTDELLKYIKG